MRRRWRRCTWRPVAIPAISPRSFDIRVRIRRRSVSILVSPGPRVPIPPPPATRPPACRDSDSPQPRSRGSMYCSCASSTCVLPSRLLACWAKMSRISAVRSITLTLTTPSSRRSWLGLSSPSQITVSAAVAATIPASSAALPAPTYVAGSTRPRRWIMPSSTTEPAVSASRLSSRSEFSALVSVPSDQTPISTTRSRRRARYSTSVISVSSVESPATRRSACRSSRSSSPVAAAISVRSLKAVVIILHTSPCAGVPGDSPRASTVSPDGATVREIRHL